MDPENGLDHEYMRQALELAGKGLGHTSPNPMVGAVVVRNGAVVGKGRHERVGGPHAEINALRDAGEATAGAVLYVTLEPCNHFGRTPPCTRAILEARIRRVVIGMMDPNPRVEGGGARFLEENGVSVTRRVLEEECRLLNQAFIKHVTTGLPYVTLKIAATLDGRIATRTGDSRWITNESSRAFVHRLRAALDGILVGIGTALADDPQLTARLPASAPVRQPVRIVLDSTLRLSLTSRLVQTAGEIPLWVACGMDAPADGEKRLRDMGAKVLRLPLKESRIDLRALLEVLGNSSLNSVLVEGGSRVHGAFLDEGLADDFHFFFAPKILGDLEAVPMIAGGIREKMSQAIAAYGMKVQAFGEDIMLSGKFRDRIF